jgi:hypothetical protein
VVIAAVGQQPIRALPGPARRAFDRLDPVGQHQQLGDVVAVAASQRDSQRDAVSVGQEMVF